MDGEVRLYNDVHFKTVNPKIYDSWTHFSRLPAELRLRIWRLSLQRNRMIEVNMYADPHNNTQPRCYADRNELGKIVSGRAYTLIVLGQGYAATLSPLLHVNSEARSAALEFYHIQLPFPQRGGAQKLYLNAEYDVVYVKFEPRFMRGTVRAPSPDTVLIDFLHDLRAYDPRDLGIAHLAMPDYAVRETLGDASLAGTDGSSWLPDILREEAAASFADILRTGRLRSLLCVVRFRSHVRGMADLPSSPAYRFHFAQTFPFHRRGCQPAFCDWLERDPRIGVEIDLHQVPLGDDPRDLAVRWQALEMALGVERRRRFDFGYGEEDGGGAEDDAGGDDVDDDFRFYVCPTLVWPTGWRHGNPEARRAPEGSRAELAEYLRAEALEWDAGRRFISDTFSLPPGMGIPRHGRVVDAETFAEMERAPSTAVGMWVFPLEAFKEPTMAAQNCFDLSGTRPGVILFDV